MKALAASQSNWRPRPLLLCHLLASLLLASFFLPVWQPIDQAAFALLNGTLKGHPLWQQFWGLANHSLVDWIADLCMLGFFTLAVLKTAKPERKARIWQFFFAVLFIAFTIILINRLLCRDLLHLRRDSPTLAIPGCTRLSELLPWLDTKDCSSKSFPGDHATTPILFAFSYAFYAGRRLGTFAFLYAAFLCLPRLMTGAHWLSDLIVGTGSIALISMGWLYFSPIGLRGPLFLQKILDLSRKHS